MLRIDVPKPSQWTKHDRVEEIATECSQAYRELQEHPAGFPADVKAFADLDLEITIDEDEIEEPEGMVVFAKICPDPEEEAYRSATPEAQAPPAWRAAAAHRPAVLRGDTLDFMDGRAVERVARAVRLQIGRPPPALGVG